MKIKIFYSWQSSTDVKYNRHFIQNCIEKAITNLNTLKEYSDIEYELLEGIRGESGMVPVAATIMDERIPSSDIFVCDLSFIDGATLKHISEEEREAFKSKHRFNQNGNVLMEFGIAYNMLGPDKIVGVMNTRPDGVELSTDLIPFDMKHLRFPITYAYDENSDRSAVKKSLIDSLTKALDLATRATMKSRRERFRPFVSWKEWMSTYDASQRFRSNALLNDIKTQLSAVAVAGSPSVRLIGLSGLGKSRVALEAFRPSDNDVDSLVLSDRVLYYDFKEDASLDFGTFFGKLHEADENKILIIDNCPVEQHRSLLKYLAKPGNRISLISIDSNPEELEAGKLKDINYLMIKSDDLKDVVEEIIAEDFPYLDDSNTEKIKEFSQGSPLMAVLLSESAREEGSIIGKIDDKLLLDKLLGAKGKEDTPRRILMSCSLFHYIGFSEDYTQQLEYIALERNITAIDIQDDTARVDRFIETCNHYLKREIFERRGRFISMRPFPLAMYLAEQWLETCTSDRMLRIITGIAAIKEVHDRSVLSESFAKQMRFLNSNAKAVQIVENMVQTMGPFHDAKVLNTELGSRLFRSFVEVNPVACSAALYSIFAGMDRGELSEIDEGRRNLIWALGKLCFDRRSFAQSAKTMFLFALAENESWSNNATGEVIHLFKLFLAGTEANLLERFNVLSWAWELNVSGSRGLALKCMKAALDASHFHRMGGAEQQGLRKLQDYEPSGHEINQYWKSILELLTTGIEEGDELADEYIKTITGAARSSARFGNFSLIAEHLVRIFEREDWDYPEGLKSLKLVKKYDISYLTPSESEALDSLISKLTKDDFLFRFEYSLEIIEDNYNFESLIQHYRELGKEFITAGYDWQEYLPVLLSSKPHYTFYFGEEAHKQLSGNQKGLCSFLDIATKILERIPEASRNYSILSGFLSDMDTTQKESFYDILLLNENLHTALLYLISSDSNGKLFFNYLFGVLEAKPEISSELHRYRFNFALANATFEEIHTFYVKLLEIDEGLYDFVLEGLNHLYYDKTLDTQSREFVKELFYRFGNSINYNNYDYAHLISRVLEGGHENEFARFINTIIIESITWENTFHLDYEVQRIYEVLISNYFDAIWVELSQALLSSGEDYVKFYGLKHILGSNIGGVGRGIGILFEGNIETIFSWAATHKIASSRLAELIPVFAGNNNKFDELHPLARRLLDEFGDHENVVENFSANMGTYSWVGSTVPLLENKKIVFKELSTHPLNKVRDWAVYRLQNIDKEIVHERNRDAEMYL